MNPLFSALVLIGFYATMPQIRPHITIGLAFFIALALIGEGLERIENYRDQRAKRIEKKPNETLLNRRR